MVSMNKRMGDLESIGHHKIGFISYTNKNNNSFSFSFFLRNVCSTMQNVTVR